jgi:hypothetical protein
MSQPTVPERRELSGLAPPASRALRSRPSGQTLDRSLYQPSGPDGEGQAEGQTR